MTNMLEIETDLMERGEIGFNEKFQTMSSQSSPTITNNTEESKETSKTCCTEANVRSSPFQRCWEHLFRSITFISGQRHNPDEDNLPELPEPYEGIRRLEYCATGYPHIAAFLDSDESFMIYRRFGYLQARILLNKQDELRDLEFKLDIYDKRDEQNDPSLLHSRDIDENSESPRPKLLKEIETKFREYADLLCAAQQMTALNKPASNDYKSVKTWFLDQDPIVRDENFIQHKEDVITLKPGRENAWLDGFLEIVLRRLRCPLVLWAFRSKETRIKTSNPRVIYFTKKRIDFLVNLIITAMILALLIVPVWLLWHLSEEIQTQRTNAITIGVLLTFTLIFSAVLSFFTRAQRHEILGAAAAYCAVLVVFISNVGNGASSGSIASL